MALETSPGFPAGLPCRRGPRPATTSALPHRQLDQQPADPAIRAALASRAGRLPGVREARSAVSGPGSQALILTSRAPAGQPAAFIIGREFAHLHPPPDGSLHLTLPEAVAAEATEAGWAEQHYLVAAGELPPTVVMIYAPRDPGELEVVWVLVRASHAFATAAIPGIPAVTHSQEGSTS